MPVELVIQANSMARLITLIPKIQRHHEDSQMRRIFGSHSAQWPFDPTQPVTSVACKMRISLVACLAAMAATGVPRLQSIPSYGWCRTRQWFSMMSRYDGFLLYCTAYDFLNICIPNCNQHRCCCCCCRGSGSGGELGCASGRVCCCRRLCYHVVLPVINHHWVFGASINNY